MAKGAATSGGSIGGRISGSSSGGRGGSSIGGGIEGGRSGGINATFSSRGLKNETTTSLKHLTNTVPKLNAPESGPRFKPYLAPASSNHDSNRVPDIFKNGRAANDDEQTLKFRGDIFRSRSHANDYEYKPAKPLIKKEPSVARPTIERKQSQPIQIAKPEARIAKPDIFQKREIASPRLTLIKPTPTESRVIVSDT